MLAAGRAQDPRLSVPGALRRARMPMMAAVSLSQQICLDFRSTDLLTINSVFIYKTRLMH
jgi:hypothetical protein